MRTNSATRAIRSQYNCHSMTLVPVDYAERGRESTGQHVPTSMKTYNLNIHNIERQFNREKATKERPFVCVCGAGYYNVTFEIFAGGPSWIHSAPVPIYITYLHVPGYYIEREMLLYSIEYAIVQLSAGYTHTHTSHTNKECPTQTITWERLKPSRIERERVWFAFDRNYLSWLYICVHIHIGDETANKATLTTRESFVRGWIHLSGQEQQPHSRRTSPVETYCSPGPVYNMSVGCVYRRINVRPFHTHTHTRWNVCASSTHLRVLNPVLFTSTPDRPSIYISAAYKTGLLPPVYAHVTA